MKLQFLFANQIGLLYQLKAEIIVDCEAFDKGEFKTQGDGFERLNKVFGGELENIVIKIHESLQPWRIEFAATQTKSAYAD
ncbi:MULTISPECIES: hypothetical protein [unclassified Nostoc]|uniref:hypothetical protein n=1 Tax=unclassified Nostoc TaxID=2593658 RepID=UPI0025E81218|nr:hypothetical protein [Nostoc sp. JL31]MBN3892298.1 hypothetical protein [Nostoc sp. JL31]